MRRSPASSTAITGTGPKRNRNSPALFDLDPNYEEGHRARAIFLLVLRRNDDALTGMRRAHELSPLSPIINVELAYALTRARRFGEAIRATPNGAGNRPRFPAGSRHSGPDVSRNGQSTSCARNAGGIRCAEGTGPLVRIPLRDSGPAAGGSEGPCGSERAERIRVAPGSRSRSSWTWRHRPGVLVIGESLRRARVLHTQLRRSACRPPAG